MAGGFESDPHSQDGLPCPRNFFGITKYEELKEVEGVYVPKRLHELRFKRISGSFDTQHLRKIHWYLFRDVFPWAGELRVVGLSKVGGAPFAYPAYIASSLANVLGALKEEKHLRGLPQRDFAKRAAEYLGHINAIHPFREGNGRTQREFLRQLALQAGHRLAWRRLVEHENTAASILSHTRGDNSGLVSIIQTALEAGERPEQVEGS
jgi:cell filamentation protein